MKTQAEKVSPKKEPRMDPVLRMTLVWGGGFIGVLALLVLIGLWLVFSSERDFSAPRLGEGHYLFLRRLATEMRNNRLEKEATLRLSPAEMQQLLDIVRHSSQFVRTRRRTLPKPEHFQLQYRDHGCVYYSIPVKVMPSWCFGGTIYVTGEASFSKYEKDVQINMPEFGVGRFDMSVPGGLDGVMPSWRDRVRRALPGEFMSAVKSINTEDGYVVLVYRPRELRRPLKKQLEQVQERCSDELRLPLEQLMKAL